MFSRNRETSTTLLPAGFRSRFKTSMTSSAKIRSSEGCWTCRLRRKKCDEARPVCEGCSSLEITCYYSETKPDWMDGGERQKEMADHLKKQVKIQANNRRERKYLRGLDVEAHENRDDSDGDYPFLPPIPALSADGGSSKGTNSNSPSTVHDTPPFDSSSPVFQFDAVKSSMADIVPGASPTNNRHHTPEWNSNAASQPSQPSQPTQSNQPSPPHDPWAPISAPVPFADLPENADVGFIMIYLDYVFPFLFPFYKPALLEGGRGWLLNILSHNKALYHTALSLSSHFFGVVLNGAQVEHMPCRIRSIASLQHQMDLALKELRMDMAALTDVQGQLLQSCRVLESIVQLLIFDVTLASNDHWLLHLDAATVLFQQIVPQPEYWDSHMQKMAIPLLQSVHFPPGSHQPWSSDQAPLRFFTASLLYFDIISATSLERPPRLQGYHQHLLSPRKENGLEIEPRLRLEEYFGCHSWALQLIGEIAALDAWKKQKRRTGTLSMTDLVSRAALLELALREGIACMEDRCPQLMGSSEMARRASACSLTDHLPPHPTHVDTTRLPPDPLTLYRSNETNDNIQASKNQTKIWAYAALAYLSTVVSGWQPSRPETASSVSATIEQLNSLPSPICLRSCVWPFCVIGCLATPRQEEMFRDMVGKMGALEVFGSIKAALGVMENVWARRDTMDEGWDLSACFNCLGQSVLLT